MAKPDTDDGWWKKSIELEAALDFADFSKPARTVLRYVFSQIFGIGKRPRLAFLPQAQIAARIGQCRQVINRAITELVASRVLVMVRDDQYRFNKDYESWVTWSRDKAKCGLPRLTDVEVEDCRNAIAYSNSFRMPESDRMDVSQVDDATSGAYASETIACKPSGLHACHPDGSQLSAIGMTNVSHMDDKTVPPYVPPSRIENEKREETNKKREGDPEVRSDIRIPGYDTTSKAESSELDALARSAADWFPNNDVIALAIVSRDGGFPIPCYRAALEKIRIVPAQKRTRSYFLTIVSDFERDGIPESPPKPAAAVVPKAGNGSASAFVALPPINPKAQRDAETRAHLLAGFKSPAAKENRDGQG